MLPFKPPESVLMTRSLMLEVYSPSPMTPSTYSANVLSPFSMGLTRVSLSSIICKSRPPELNPIVRSLRPSAPEVIAMVPVPKSGICTEEMSAPKPATALSTLSMSALSIVTVKVS